MEPNQSKMPPLLLERKHVLRSSRLRPVCSPLSSLDFQNPPEPSSQLSQLMLCRWRQLQTCQATVLISDETFKLASERRTTSRSSVQSGWKACSAPLNTTSPSA